MFIVPSIGVGPRKYLGVQRIFTQIFPNLPKKFLCNFAARFFGMTSKKWFSLVFLQTLGAILPRYLGILSKFSGIFPGFSTNQKF